MIDKSYFSLVPRRSTIANILSISHNNRALSLKLSGIHMKLKKFTAIALSDKIPEQINSIPPIPHNNCKHSLQETPEKNQNIKKTRFLAPLKLTKVRQKHTSESEAKIDYVNIKHSKTFSKNKNRIIVFSKIQSSRYENIIDLEASESDLSEILEKKLNI